jgi:NADPH-dependent 2,4-dienoyl-CoA reductase/sulfur reductase-like enzyme
VEEYYRGKGVLMHMGERVAEVTARNGGYLVRTNKGNELEADGVVAGLGIQPSVELAQQAGLQVDNGVVVNEFCATSTPDVYAAGDVALFPNPALGTRIRVEHEDNANTMGRTAGLNLAGGEARYDHLPFFYSDLFELGYEAVGELDPRLVTFSDWVEPFRQGVVYYLKDGRIRGVLLWNTWGQVDAARALIAEPGPFTADALKGRIR